ncbi:MAG: excinuclease ABC subunit UvrA [Planctomycetaceae bacterium]|nr:excinuclease ABC subunit UvrA [Planctomycetaceae bacterium]
MPSEIQNAAECIRIRGARTHNLQNIDLDLPRDQFVVVTGPSGSGKSSLSFDTLYAEGQRQYIESLSTYARQFLHQLERPDVDLIEGLQPTISIDQRAGSNNPRSTVATVTEIYDYLRLLYARLGEPRCHKCGAVISQQTPEQILDVLMDLSQGTRAMILAPMVRGRKGEHKEVFETIRKAGLLRARVDGQIVDIDNPPALALQKSHDIEAVVDRVVVREGVRARIAESVRLAIRHGDGLVIAAREEKTATGSVWHDRLFSTLYACPNCRTSFEELEPRTFSFNSPYGACPRCEGLGARVGFDPELVLPDTELSLAEGAIAPWRDGSPAAERRHRQQLEPFLAKAGIDWNTPLATLSEKRRDELLNGAGKRFCGVLNMLEKEYATTSSETKRQRLESFRGEVVCPECQGARLRPEARSVFIGGRAIHEVTRLPISAAKAFFAGLDSGNGAGRVGENAVVGGGPHPSPLPEGEGTERDGPHPSALPEGEGTVDNPFAKGEQRLIAHPILSEITARLDFMDRVGLGYLTLDRPAGTLSGGELQRVRLAAGLGSGLVGVCYVLDEPSIGLHPRDNDRLIEVLRQLQSRGNTVLVVEHDEAIMRHADWLVDLGPGAGRHGGRVVAEGSPQAIAENRQSLTGRYLAGVERIPVPERRRRAVKSRSITIEGVTTNNLKDVSVWFPLGTLVCVTGVSGSGKSSLVDETLARALVRRLGGVAPKAGPHRSIRGASQVDKVIQIDQSPIGRTPRSNPATYAGVFDEIRKVFANTRDARQRGYKAGRFSFNLKGGRCEECQGQGQRRIEMNFLPDLYVDCPVCEGKRFNRQTLEIRYRDRSIADVLDMRVEEAVEFFANFLTISRLIGGLLEVGLGYMALGQSSTTLSGGESQRIKLATELSRVETGKTLYILDEPTTGLHFDDIRKLLAVLDRLVDLGNTVIVIEHNLDVMKTADWIIDLGPEGGEAGGRVVATGTPEEIAGLEDNHTGRFLRTALS